MTLLKALIHYANERHLGPLPADPGDLPIPVGGKDKLLRNCSVQDLTQATKALKPRPKQSLPFGVTAALMLMRSGAKALNVPVRIDARVSPSGEVFIDLRDVPWKSLAGLVGAIAKVLPPPTSVTYLAEEVAAQERPAKRRAAGRARK